MKFLAGGRRCLARLLMRWISGTVFAAAFASAAVAEELVFLTWADYINPDLVAEFEAEFGVELEIVVFELDEARDSLLVKRGPSAYDLMLVDGASVAGYVRRGWLAPIPMSDVPNFRHLKPAWTKAHDQTEGNAVPYMWGTTGIAYRSDLVSGTFHSWRQLMEPEEALRGRISMMGAGRDLLIPGLKMLGQSLNVTNASVILATEAMLLAQKPYVKTYVYLSMKEDSLLVTGDVWVSLMYSGGAKMLQALEPAIKYVVPDEGTSIWVDYIGISAQSPRKQLAAQFINFLNRPEIAARNALWAGYATPNLAAEKHLPDSFREDPIIYPKEPVLKRSEFFRELSPRVKKSLNASLNRIFN